MIARLQQLVSESALQNKCLRGLRTSPELFRALRLSVSENCSITVV